MKILFRRPQPDELAAEPAQPVEPVPYRPECPQWFIDCHASLSRKISSTPESVARDLWDELARWGLLKDPSGPKNASGVVLSWKKP